MMRNKFQLVGLSLVLALVLAACGGDETPTLRVSMSDFKFAPTHWQAPAGAQVTINAVNEGGADHEWLVVQRDQRIEAPFDEADRGLAYWGLKLKRSEQGEFTFTAPGEPGEYQIICSIPGHLELGMQGTLIVKPAEGEAVASR
jgi:uncharacterized cupredoxin-like copper-binding protein